MPQPGLSPTPDARAPISLDSPATVTATSPMSLPLDKPHGLRVATPKTLAWSLPPLSSRFRRATQRLDTQRVLRHRQMKAPPPIPIQAVQPSETMLEISDSSSETPAPRLGGGVVDGAGGATGGDGRSHRFGGSGGGGEGAARPQSPPR